MQLKGKKHLPTRIRIVNLDNVNVCHAWSSDDIIWELLLHAQLRGGPRAQEPEVLLLPNR